MKFWKSLVLILSVTLLASDVLAQKKDNPSSKPSGSSSSKPAPSSSKPTPSAPKTEAPKPKYSSPSAPPKVEQKVNPALPKVETPKPKYSSPSLPPKTEQKLNPEPPKTEAPKPKYSSPSLPPKGQDNVSIPKSDPPKATSTPSAKPLEPKLDPKPKYSSPTVPSSTVDQKTNPNVDQSVKPLTGQPAPNPSVDQRTNPNKPINNAASSKPKSTGVSEKAQANKEAYSERKYAESVKATAPPKTTYKTPDGREEKVRVESKHVEYIRNQPSSRYTPEVRQRTVVTHIDHYHYQHPYNYYYSQPVVYVGGGYSSSFWWMMAEWDAERRARWFYNNQHNIDQAAYQRGLQDAAVANEIARLKAQNARIDPDYVDPEFNSDPTLMYDDNYIHAAYNPAVDRVSAPSAPVDPAASAAALKFLFWSFVVSIAIVAGVWLIFVKRWGK